MSDIGKLCKKKGSSSLAYKKGGSALIFKVNKPGDVYVMITSDQSEVGPIKSCGNIHKVVINPECSFSTGSGTYDTSTPSDGSSLCTIHIYSAPASINVSCTTRSSGCHYEDENPPMGFSISAAQGKGNPSTTRKNVGNVAKGSFSFVVSVNADGFVTGVA